MQKGALDPRRRSEIRNKSIYDKYRGSGETIDQAKLTIECLDALDAASGAMWAVLGVLLKSEAILYQIDKGWLPSAFERNGLRNAIEDLKRELENNLP